MEGQIKSKRKIIPVIIIVLALIAILIVVYFLFIKSEKVSNPIPLAFENYNSILNANVQGYSVTLNDDGYIMLNLDSSEYLLYYTLNQCTNPSENFDYSYTNPNGVEVSYDPLKEKIVLTNEGAEKQTLSDTEQNNALLTEKVYVLGTEGTDSEGNLPISKSGTMIFNADGSVKFSFESKCDDSSLTLKLYSI